MKEIIAIINHKGGVGKTTTTLNLGRALAEAGQQTLLIDIDPQANLSQSVGVEEPDRSIYHAMQERTDLPIHPIGENLHLTPSDLLLSTLETSLYTDVNGYFLMRNALQHEARYDYVLFDCPPSLGILTLNALVAATRVIIVVESQYLALKGLETIIELVGSLQQNLNPKLAIAGILLTKVNHTVASKTIVENCRQTYRGRLPVFQTLIRQNVKINEASIARQTVLDYDPESYGAADYRALAQEVLHPVGAPAHE